MKTLSQNGLIVVFSSIFIALLSYFIWTDSALGYVIPIALVGVYVAFFHPELSLYAILAFTPLSVNIEEWVDGFGLFVPTEPILACNFLLLLFQGIRTSILPLNFNKSALIWALIVYFSWLIICAVASTHPAASFKFILARLWFIVPLFVLVPKVIIDTRKIRLFLWIFVFSMTAVMLYTLVMHASYAFGEKESHWVMWPFFKDHTIYGALVALVLPFPFALIYSRKMSPIALFVLYACIGINLLALYFSYTRAAQLSVVLSVVIGVLIYYKIKFSYIFGTGVFFLLVVLLSWTSIQQNLAKNKEEHTTENFSDRISSATNVTTDASNVERINRWNCAIDMFQKKPVFGYGPGTYAFEYAPFQRPENLTIISTNFGDGGNAHSEFLGPLAETGLIGMLSVIALVAALFYEGITLYNRLSIGTSDEKQRAILIFGMLISLCTYFIHAFLNNYLDTDKAAVPIWTMAAIFLSQKYSKQESTSLVSQ